jgi:hypothetical protein
MQHILRNEEKVKPETCQTRFLGNVANPLAHAPALLLQDFAYSCRVWITLIKLLYVPLRYYRPGPNIHAAE